MDLTDEQWAVVEPFLPKPVKRADGKGRPRVDNRAILNGILLVMRTGAPWHDLPNRYPPYQTCHRRFQEWVQSRHLRDHPQETGTGCKRTRRLRSDRMFH
jgi:transposase